MEKRQIGKTGIFVNPVGLGCMGFSHAYGSPMEKDEAVKIIRQAIEMGYDFLDTAECYTGINPDGSTNYNEELVGEAIKPYRDKVILATKFGVTHSPTGLIMDSSPDRIRSSLEGSLKRLGTDYVDIYYQHRPDPKVEPEVVAGVMKELIASGKVKYWGISETDEEYLRRANAVCPVTVIQNRYSMIAREQEKMFSVCKELGITFVAYSPMANGFLTGAYDKNSVFEKGIDYRSNMPQYTEEGFKSREKLQRLLKELAAKKNCTEAAISLAWMMCKEEIIIPIPGSRKPERLAANFAAGNVLLTKEEIKEIDNLLDEMAVPVYGRR